MTRAEASARRESSRRPIRAAVTVDLHGGDVTDDVRRSGDWLTERGIAATYFVPTGLLSRVDFRAAVRHLVELGHEVGSHGHLHNRDEKDALRFDDAASLGFLALSRRAFEDGLGRPPLSFRSPLWVRVGENALAELSRLGYLVDSSATPQRLGVLSSYPTDNPWLTAPRRPTFVSDGLMEIPTSAFAVPLGSPAFTTLRRWGSVAFLSLFITEAAVLRERVVTLQLHAGDLVAEGEDYRSRPKGLADFVPRENWGFGVKHWFRVRDRRRVCEIARALIRRLEGASLDTLSGHRARIVEEIGVPPCSRSAS